MKKLSVIFLIIMFFTVGCASTMVIESDVPGSEVYVDGELIGPSPATYSGKSGLNKSAEITVKKDGYENAHKVVTQQIGTGHIVACLLLFWPCALWSAYWPNHVNVAQRPARAGITGAGTGQETGAQQQMQGPTVIIQQDK